MCCPMTSHGGRESVDRLCGRVSTSSATSQKRRNLFVRKWSAKLPAAEARMGVDACSNKSAPRNRLSKKCHFSTESAHASGRFHRPIGIPHNTIRAKIRGQLHWHNEGFGYGWFESKLRNSNVRKWSGYTLETHRQSRQRSAIFGTRAQRRNLADTACSFSAT
jgi:hypothetical protein